MQILYDVIDTSMFSTLQLIQAFLVIRGLVLMGVHVKRICTIGVIDACVLKSSPVITVKTVSKPKSENKRKNLVMSGANIDCVVAPRERVLECAYSQTSFPYGALSWATGRASSPVKFRSLTTAMTVRRQVLVLVHPGFRCLVEYIKRNLREMLVILLLRMARDRTCYAFDVF